MKIALLLLCIFFCQAACATDYSPGNALEDDRIDPAVAQSYVDKGVCSQEEANGLTYAKLGKYIDRFQSGQKPPASPVYNDNLGPSTPSAAQPPSNSGNQSQPKPQSWQPGAAADRAMRSVGRFMKRAGQGAAIGTAAGLSALGSAGRANAANGSQYASGYPDPYSNSYGTYGSYGASPGYGGYQMMSNGPQSSMIWQPPGSPFTTINGPGLGTATMFHAPGSPITTINGPGLETMTMFRPPGSPITTITGPGMSSATMFQPPGSPFTTITGPGMGTTTMFHPPGSPFTTINSFP